MEFKLENRILTVFLKGRIDSVNAEQIETELTGIRAANPAKAVILDLEGLDYISSAGLRVILRLKQAVSRTSLVNVRHDIYEILDMTGFTEMMEIEKAYRVISVEGCEVIGQGANGKVCRIDRDTVVKVYHNPDALEDIRKERELARTAFVLGVPTAIPYDVVKIEGGGYGSVFELLNASSFASLLIHGEKTLDEIVRMSVDLLRIIHRTKVDPESMPSMRQIAITWADYLKNYLPDDQFRKLRALVAAVPEDYHMLHGDYHIKNITRQGEENLILDMDTLSHGNPVFELASMFNAYCGFSELNPGVTKEFLGIDQETADAIWYKSLRLYLGTEDENTVRTVENKAKVVGYMRLLRRSIRRHGMETEKGRAEIACCRDRLTELLSRVDSLVF